MHPNWIILLVFVLVFSLIIWAILSARKRTQELMQIAPQLGFTFMGKAWHGPALDSRHRTCLLQRNSGNFSNVMVGVSGGLEAIVFDYNYRQGKSSSTQTLACFSQKLQLPPFSLKPEGIFDRLGDALFHNDIDFDSHPEFSRRYALKSPDESGTRRLFTPSLLSSMEQMPADKNWIVEANGTNLFIYRPNRTVPPTELSTFLQETSTLARTIFSSDGLKNSVA